MQTETPIADVSLGDLYLHLAAVEAPTLNIPVRFADEASKAFSAYRDTYSFGASEMKAGCGNIYNSKRQIIGRISYNGRIWDAENRPVEPNS
ncbi:MAG TPA: hypothetical protein VK578_24035 [Edaphobacter sp.]|nr:hypothetical protein [Edaphobacter sp.]